MSSKKILLGVIVGAAAGAVLGVLFAPDKGSDLKSKISDIGEGYLGSIKTMFDNFLDTLSQSIETAKGDAEDLIQKGKSKVDEVKSKIKDAANDKVSSQH